MKIQISLDISSLGNALVSPEKNVIPLACHRVSIEDIDWTAWTRIVI